VTVDRHTKACILLDFPLAVIGVWPERVDSWHSPGRRLVPRLDRSQRVIERQEASCHPPPDFLAVIPIGVFHAHRCRHGIVITIPANNENRSRSRWNRVHVPLEYAFTMR